MNQSAQCERAFSYAMQQKRILAFIVVSEIRSAPVRPGINFEARLSTQTIAESLSGFVLKYTFLKSISCRAIYILVSQLTNYLWQEIGESERIKLSLYWKQASEPVELP